MTVVERPARPAVERSPWKTVAVPSEHGGWGLTAEPILLGLLVAFTWSGVAVGVAALLAFLLRTPLKLTLVDLRRGRWLARSRLATAVAGSEFAVIAGLAALVIRADGWGWLVPVLIAAPLVAVELWFDIRSRGRRLVPELCGAAGIAASAASIAVIGGGSARLGAALWLVLAGRAVGSIPFVRSQIIRLRRGVTTTTPSDAAQAVMVAAGVVAVALDRRALLGAIALVILAVFQLNRARHDPPPPKVLGVRQMLVGFGLVAIVAAGVLAAQPG